MKNYKKYYLTSESVTEGHPDKVCDFISDSMLDACLEQDKNSRVAVETFISNGKVVVAGQITSNAIIDIEKIVREKLKEVGYDEARYNMDYRTCDIDINITKQSGDIAMGVDLGGAGDQGIMFGFACNETDSLMPYAIDTAHKLAQRLTKVRKDGIIPYLKSDGKVQLTVEYLNDIPFRIDTILISTQHTEDIDMDTLENDIIEYVIKPTIEDDMVDIETKILINPTGRFVVGGAVADTGLTGRKINGLARKCELQVSYGIGIEEPLSIYIDCFGTNIMPEGEIMKIIKASFDLTPKGIIDYLRLKKPIYSKTTNYGHFGRDGFSWEKVKQI